MRQVNLEQFKRHLGKELLNLPLELTKRGKVIAVIISPNHTVQGSKQAKPKPNHTVQDKKPVKPTTNHTVQTNIDNPDDVKKWADKRDNTGKFQTYFKK